MPFVSSTRPRTSTRSPPLPLMRSAPTGSNGDPVLWNGPSSLDSVAPCGLLMRSTSEESPSTSEVRMNSFLRSSEIFPAA
ncbi:hypothetical protein D3C83_85250 [compost metagenome]